MHDSQIRDESFEGIGGRVLTGSISVEAVFTGVILGATLGGATWALAAAGQADAAPLAALLLVTLALARIAVNGAAGERRGALLSTEGGSWAWTAQVALRFLALSALWVIPFELLGWKAGDIPRTLATLAMGQGGGPSIGATLAALFVMAASPPLLLIVAVGAPGWLGLVTPHTWTTLFRGRGSSLLVVYALTLGGTVLVALPAVAAVILLALQGPQAARIGSWVATAIVSGIGIDLLARLAGFFVLSGAPVEPVERELEETAAPELGYGGHLAPVVWDEQPAAPPASAPVIQPQFRSAGYLPTLVNPRERIQEIVEGFRREPDRVIFELENLHAQYAPDPLVLHSLCVLHERAGRHDRSAEIAGEALTVCLAHNARRLAAEVLATHADRAAEFHLDVETMASLGDTLLKHRDPARSESVFRALLAIAPGERRAIKGLLQVAEAWLRPGGDPPRARAIYAILLETTGENPYTGFMREGLAEAERRMAG